MNAADYIELVKKFAKLRKGERFSDDPDWFIKPLMGKFSICKPGEEQDDIEFNIRRTRFYPLTEAKKHVSDIDAVKNWLYDRTTGVVIVDMEMGSHEAAAQYLYCLYTGKDESTKGGFFKGMRDNAHTWIRTGMGFFLSSISSRVQKGEDVKLSAQEKAVFRGYEFIDI